MPTEYKEFLDRKKNLHKKLIITIWIKIAYQKKKPN